MKGIITKDNITYEFRPDEDDPSTTVILVSSTTNMTMGGAFSVPDDHADLMWGTIVRGMAREPARVCRIVLLHGRTKVGPPTNEQGVETDDWGFDGPTLENVLAWHWTYGDQGRVFFATSADARRAHEETGWEFFDGNALEVPQLVDDLLPAGGNFFGDWEVQASSQ